MSYVELLAWCMENTIDLCKWQPFNGYSIMFYDFLRSDNWILWFTMFSMVFSMVVSMAFLCVFYGLSIFFYGLFLSFLYGFLPFLMVPLYFFRVFMTFHWSITGNLWLFYGFSMVFYGLLLVFYDFLWFLWIFLCYKFGLKNTQTMCLLSMCLLSQTQVPIIVIMWICQFFFLKYFNSAYV